MNLIAKGYCKTPNYYCTWTTQNYGRENVEIEENIAVFEGDQGAKNARQFINEETIFSKEGMINQFDKIRKDLYFVLDDGWDVPYNVHPDTKYHMFGSLELNVERFPNLIGTPAERLKALNNLVKSFGWRGAGLWVAAQETSDGKDKDSEYLSSAELEKYWRERARWTNYAGIEYWKVDWGKRSGDPEFRRMLTRVAREEAPNLIIEHCRGCGPLNDFYAPWETAKELTDGRYHSYGDILKDSLEALTFSDVLRTYDVTPHLSTATTIDRIASILIDAKVDDGSLGIINCEDEIYLGAALGCSFGVMRSGKLKTIPKLNYDPRKTVKCLDEVTRSVRWQRISPAYRADRVETFLSDEVLTDSWLYKKGDTWASWAIGKEIKQSCPAIISRGIALPKVESPEEQPFVVASRNPNGAVSIAALPRTQTDKGIYLPLAHVELFVGNDESPIGIFGKYARLELVFDKTIVNKRVWAQDLAGENAEDITDKVTITENRLVISGGIIQQVGLRAATIGDLSDPGLVIKIL